MVSSVPTIFTPSPPPFLFDDIFTRHLTNFYHLSAEVQGLKPTQKEISLFPL